MDFPAIPEGGGWVSKSTTRTEPKYVSYDGFAARVIILHQFQTKIFLRGPPGAKKSPKDPKKKLSKTLAYSGRFWLTLADSGRLWMTFDDSG